MSRENHLNRLNRPLTRQGRPLHGLFLAALAGLALATVLSAVPPVGCYPIALKGGSDNVIALPLERAALYEGPLTEILHDTIVVHRFEPWSPDELAGSGESGEFHFVQIASGPLEGATFTILGNASDRLQIDLDGMTTAELQAALTGHRIRILPFWTPASVFAHTSVPDRSQIHLRDRRQGGVNRNPDSILTYYTGHGWFDSSFNPADGYPLRRHLGFTVRTPEHSPDFHLDLIGVLPVHTQQMTLESFSGPRGTDIWLGLNQPESLTLGNAGFDLADRTILYTFDERGYNSSPSQIYTFYENYGWYDAVFSPAGDVALEAGHAYILRLPPDSVGLAWTWSFSPAYLENL